MDKGVTLLLVQPSARWKNTSNGENIAEPSGDKKGVVTVQKEVTAIPYHAWNNRGAATMQVWLPTALKNIKINYE